MASIKRICLSVAETGTLSSDQFEHHAIKIWAALMAMEAPVMMAKDSGNRFVPLLLLHCSSQCLGMQRGGRGSPGASPGPLLLGLQAPGRSSDGLSAAAAAAGAAAGAGLPHLSPPSGRAGAAPYSTQQSSWHHDPSQVARQSFYTHFQACIPESGTAVRKSLWYPGRLPLVLMTPACLAVSSLVLAKCSSLTKLLTANNFCRGIQAAPARVSTKDKAQANEL